jgi:hypothetical protein
MALYFGKTKACNGSGNQSEWKIYFDNGGKLWAYNDYKAKITTLAPYLDFSDTADVTDFSHMFANNTALTTIPKLDMRKGTNFYSIFANCASLTALPKFDLSSAQDLMGFARGCSSLVEVPAFDTRNATSFRYMFMDCSSLKEAPALDVGNADSNGGLGLMLGNCAALERVHLKNIKQDLDISASTLYTAEALLEVLGNLATITDTQTLTLGATNLAKLTDAEKAIATSKGWTLA